MMIDTKKLARALVILAAGFVLVVSAQPSQTGISNHTDEQWYTCSPDTKALYATNQRGKSNVIYRF